MIDQPKTKKRPPFIFIVIASIAGLCVVCVAGTSVMDALGFIPTSTPSLVPTSTILPTNTSSPQPTNASVSMFEAVALADYPRVAASRFQTVQEALSEFIPLHQQLVTDISLAADKDWWAHTSATLLRVESGIHEIASMQNFPPELSAFNQTMLQLDQETQLLSPEYTLALENQDTDALTRANNHLGNMIVLVNQAFSELNSSLPTATLAPTATSIPTNPPVPTSTIYIPPAQPTSAHPAGTSGQCKDGTYTSAKNKQGACSHHGGVSIWWGP